MKNLNGSAVGGSNLAHADNAATPNGVIRRPLALIRTWRGRARVRRHLSKFDDHMLADIGVRRADVKKPFWQP